jgi:ABC-type branched-subunit amino acid transport system substrate-binding protein
VKETAQGARMYIDKVNEAGGIRGEKIEIIALDDKFDPKIAAENARILVEEKNVVALFLTRGTPHNEAILPLLDKDHVPLIGPSTGAMVLHEPLKRYVFNVRATYQREAQKAIEHLAFIGVKRIAVVNADDSFGRDGFEGTMKGFAAAQLQPVAVVKADRAKPDFKQIVPALVGARPDAVVWIASGNAVADGVQALRAAGSGAQIVTLSNNASTGFIKSLGKNARGVMVTQVFPNERALTTPFVGEAQALVAASGGAELSPATLEGFAAAKVLVEALRRAGPHPTRAKLQAALEGMSKFDLGGIELGYSPSNHTGLTYADLSIVTESGHFRR